MVAAAQFSVFQFIGLNSGQTYNVDAYISDVANALVRFDAGSGSSATSPTEWIAPEPVSLVDVALVTGLTDTTKMDIVRANASTGNKLRYAMHLTTLAFRPKLNIPFAAGAKVSAVQLA